VFERTDSIILSREAEPSVVLGAFTAFGMNVVKALSDRVEDVYMTFRKGFWSAVSCHRITPVG
jgi:hypothetical protein